MFNLLKYLFLLQDMTQIPQISATLLWFFFCSPPFGRKVIIVFSNSFHRFSRSVLIADILCLLLNFAACLFILFLLTCLFCRIPWDECSEYIRCDLDPRKIVCSVPSLMQNSICVLVCNLAELYTVCQSAFLKKSL